MKLFLLKIMNKSHAMVSVPNYLICLLSYFANNIHTNKNSNYILSNAIFRMVPIIKAKFINIRYLYFIKHENTVKTITLFYVVENNSARSVIYCGWVLYCTFIFA